MTLILSADRTCDLSEELIAKYDVHTIPYHVLLDEKEYYDNVDITPNEIYQVYYDKKVVPKTSAINQHSIAITKDKGCIGLAHIEKMNFKSSGLGNRTANRGFLCSGTTAKKQCQRQQYGKPQSFHFIYLPFLFFTL